jgi:hypothetical protein
MDDLIFFVMIFCLLQVQYNGWIMSFVFSSLSRVQKLIDGNYYYYYYLISYDHHGRWMDGLLTRYLFSWSAIKWMDDFLLFRGMGSVLVTLGFVNGVLIKAIHYVNF